MITRAEALKEFRMFISYLNQNFPLSKMMGINLRYDRIQYVFFSEN